MRRNQCRTPSVNTDTNWRRLPLETIGAVWHLYRGGLSVAQIADRLKLHGATCNSLSEWLEIFVAGPLPLAKPVRCSHCGFLLNEIPCHACGWKHEKYRVPEREPAESPCSPK